MLQLFQCHSFGHCTFLHHLFLSMSPNMPNRCLTDSMPCQPPRSAQLLCISMSELCKTGKVCWWQGDLFRQGNEELIAKCRRQMANFNSCHQIQKTPIKSLRQTENPKGQFIFSLPPNISPATHESVLFPFPEKKIH